MMLVKAIEEANLLHGINFHVKYQNNQKGWCEVIYEETLPLESIFRCHTCITQKIIFFWEGIFRDRYEESQTSNVLMQPNSLQNKNFDVSYFFF